MRFSRWFAALLLAAMYAACSAGRTTGARPSSPRALYSGRYTLASLPTGWQVFLDGVRLDRATARQTTLNADDIQSIEIVRGRAARAFGLAAADSGAILITTKRATGGANAGTPRF